MSTFWGERKGKIVEFSLWCLCLFFLEGKAQNITFGKAQPEGEPSLVRLPKAIQGEFLDLADSSTLVISDHWILWVDKKQNEKCYARLLSNEQHPALSATKEKISALSLLDQKSLMICPKPQLDTLFNLSAQHVLKKEKEIYILNYYRENKGWELKLLAFREGRLYFRSVVADSDAALLREVSKSEWESSPYGFRPTKKQFREFLDRLYLFE